MLSENTMPLLDFLYELPKGYHDYPAHVLRLIDQYLGYHMLTFIPLNSSFLDLRNVDPKTWINEYRTLGISRELLEIYNLRGHKLDPFRACRLPQKLWMKPVVAAEEVFPPGEFLRSEYGQYLAELGIPYQMVLNLTFKNVRLGVISIYHSLRDGPFTSEDKEILSQASRFIAQHYLLAMGKNQRSMTTNLFNSCYKKLDFGVIMVDHNFTVLNANPAAEQYASAICQAMTYKQRVQKGIPSSQQSDIQTVLRCYNNNLFYSGRPLSVAVGGSTYDFHVNSFVSSTQNLSRVEIVYLVFVLKTDTQSLPHHDSQVRLSLTEREWEIADLIAKGLTNNQIAEQTSISIHTVKSHILNIYKKANVGNRTSLLRVLGGKDG